MLERQICQGLIRLVQGDITEMDTDAVVNAANERLLHGGGVAAAIVRKGGMQIQQESHEWVIAHGLVKTGSAAITSGGRLKARHVIHAVGPVMGSGNEDAKLYDATRSALQLADEHKLKSIAFPAISTGIFGYPVDRCAIVMLNSVCDHLHDGSSLVVTICLYDQKTFHIFYNELSNMINLQI